MMITWLLVVGGIIFSIFSLGFAITSGERRFVGYEISWALGLQVVACSCFYFAGTP